MRPQAVPREPVQPRAAPGRRAKASGKRKADDDASSGGGTTRSGRAKGVVSRYDPTAVARAPQWGRAPSPKDGKTRRASMGCTSGADRRFEPLDRAALPPCAPENYAPEPDLLYAAAWAPSADAADDLARLRRRAGPASTAEPAGQRCGDDAPLRRSVTGDLLAALYARRTYYGDDDSSVGAFEAEHGVDDDASDSESSEEEDDDGARVVVCDDWAGERAVRESVLLPLADRAARRFYDRARASWGGASWDLRRGKTGAETLAPQICEPGNPNARYTVLCVEIYVDSDDNTPVMAFRWFYKKSDLDKKLGADVDAKDELVLARSIHSTPLEYVRGAVVVHDSDGPAKAAGPKGKRAPVFFCTRDYDERRSAQAPA
ncbi:chlorophyl binding protein [Aureococcus anophagefferens]|nr:chlorophyl binding protein [Aureococcus anophagefferens]